MRRPGALIAGVAERGVFERNGWAHLDSKPGLLMDQIYQRPDAFLFGPLTYENFAASWERGTTRATARSGRR
jgi:hypothetical protein